GAGLALGHEQPMGAWVLVELFPLAVVVRNDQRHAAILDWLGHSGLLASPHDERAAGRRHGPAEVHRDLGVLDLAAVAGRIVVGANALGGARAIVGHSAARLA